MLSADCLCKQFEPRSGLTKLGPWSGSKLFDTLTVFLKEFFEEKKRFWKKAAEGNYPVGKELNFISSSENQIKANIEVYKQYN